MEVIGKVKILFVSFFLILLSTSNGNLAAQEVKTDSPATAGQIVLNVTVVNKDGDLVTGLESHNFKVYDEKTLQPVTYFQIKEEPLSVGILFDISGSAEMTGYKLAPRGLKRFVETSNPANEYFLMAFNDKQHLLLDYSQDQDAVFQTFEKLSALKAQKNTSFFDALHTGIEKISKGKHSKRILIVVSDGMDNTSDIRLNKVKNALRKSNILVYAVGIMSSSNGSHDLVGAAYLEEIAGLSGGKAYFPQTEKEIRAFCVVIANQLRNQYAIGFKPGDSSKTDKKEKWRNLKVEVELPPDVSRKIGKIHVRTRKGYYSNVTSN
jgi:Ca-activated chloride channel family protein